jgi:hypothetical protein
VEATGLRGAALPRSPIAPSGELGALVRLEFEGRPTRIRLSAAGVDGLDGGREPGFHSAARAIERDAVQRVTLAHADVVTALSTHKRKG